jgi:hypothetical protein
MSEMTSAGAASLKEVLAKAPWRNLEEHISDLPERVDRSITASHDLRRRYREELLAQDPTLPERIRRPSEAALAEAIQLMQTGVVAAADGTVAPVPLVGGAKIQVAVVIVFNSGQVVDLVTRVFEHELDAESPDDQSLDEARPGFIHLKDVRIRGQQGTLPNVPWWRGRLAAVDGFFFGTPT